MVSTPYAFNPLRRCNVLWIRSQIRLVSLPTTLETFGNEKKDARHTFDFFSNSVGEPSRKFVNPFFICSDNEAKMIAAFDGRYDTNGPDLAGQVGCVKHALAICISDVFEKDAQKDLKLFIKDRDIL